MFQWPQPPVTCITPRVLAALW
uniref:Uncharacterized protein n=1 Tax=Anguilla anguilla TaxID=7936 RepID=A0A0E9XEA0_ANGAN